MWFWIASDAKTKIIPVMQGGARTQEMAYSVVHELKRRLAIGCLPVFSVGAVERLYLQPGYQTPWSEKNRGSGEVSASRYKTSLANEGPFD